MRFRFPALAAWLAAAVVVSAQSPARIDAPHFWNDRELSDWATPLVGLDARPGHVSEREYYATPDAEWVRTYPVYFPGREPEGYWDMLRAKKPEPLITPGARTSRDWITDGQRVFEEMDVPGFRSTDPALIAIARSLDEFSKRGGHAQKDGTVVSLRWVPTAKGLALSIPDCATCHTRIMPDGSLLRGAPFNDPADAVLGELVTRGTTVFYPGESVATINWRSFGVPWLSNDIHARLKTMPDQESGELFASAPPGTFARFNGSPYFITKAPDLIGISDRTFIDHTATHRLRGPEDVMRYAALVSCCDPADFGTHHMLTPSQEKPLYKLPDDLAFALTQYIYSLEPPPNPNSKDARAAAGQRVFTREGCATCHTPPLYTNNKLTLATGFTPPSNHPLAADIMPISVGTDPNLALRTRKGTGFYKVPSLKGVWYRGLYNHDGSVASLEEWLDPARLRDDFVPSGFKGYKVSSRAVPGHRFGLNLSADDKTALIAFLRTL
jgi:mono/diheme cytochrome c family protein